CFHADFTGLAIEYRDGATNHSLVSFQLLQDPLKSHSRRQRGGKRGSDFQKCRKMFVRGWFYVRQVCCHDQFHLINSPKIKNAQNKPFTYGVFWTSASKKKIVRCRAAPHQSL